MMMQSSAKLCTWSKIQGTHNLPKRKLVSTKTNVNSLSSQHVYFSQEMISCVLLCDTAMEINNHCNTGVESGYRHESLNVSKTLVSSVLLN